MAPMMSREKSVVSLLLDDVSSMPWRLCDKRVLVDVRQLFLRPLSIELRTNKMELYT